MIYKFNDIRAADVKSNMYFTLLLVVLFNIEFGALKINDTDRSIKNDRGTDSVEKNYLNQSVLSETQYTMCSIKTDDVIAKAQSTASRILTGVCTSEEMSRSLKNLEKIFLEKLEEIHQDLAVCRQTRHENPPPEKPIRNPAFRTVDYLFRKNT